MIALVRSSGEAGAVASAHSTSHSACLAAVLCSAAALGCGPQPSSQTQPVDPRTLGDPSAPPTLSALPELPRGASGVSERTHQGMLVVRQTLDAALPEPPSDRSLASLQRWADTQVAGWIAERQAQMESARARMLEGKPSAGEAILSHAVLALLHEDTARALAAIPAPKELDSEQEIAEMYRELMSGQADTFAASALLELRECANQAYRGPEDMRAFAAYCHARFDRLRGETLARQGEPAAGTRPDQSAAAKAP
jgi:hypothetical protein